MSVDAVRYAASTYRERARLAAVDPAGEAEAIARMDPLADSLSYWEAQIAKPLPVRSYARVRSVAIATSLEGRTTGTARATRSEVAKALERAPLPVLDYQADASLLDDLAACYSRVTGRPADRVTLAQRRFLASCYRVHGDQLERVLREIHADSGEINLLLRARSASPP